MKTSETVVLKIFSLKKKECFSRELKFYPKGKVNIRFVHSEIMSHCPFCVLYSFILSLSFFGKRIHSEYEIM